jgi:2-methylaconitate cis-trans-isomerase PrpF
MEMRMKKGQPYIVSCTLGRTARKIMDGKVYVPVSVYGVKR